MNWHSRSEVPPLGKESIAAGGQFGGDSVPLIHRHKSGRISAGRACLYEGKVFHWYPGEIGDTIRIPESMEDEDQIVEWAECPTAAQIVGLLELMGPLTIQLDSFIKAVPETHPCREQTQFVEQSRKLIGRLVDDGVLDEEGRV